MRTCVTCKQQLPAAAFGKDASRPDGLENRCKQCRAIAAKARYVPRPRKPRPIKHGVGSVFGELTIVERLPKVNGSNRAICRCACGNTRTFNVQNLISGATVHCGNREAHPDPRSKGEEIAYETAHHKIERERGKASEHRCWFCGRRADHWAYLHADLDEKTDDGRTYSIEPRYYVPLCRSHHGRFDRAHAKWSGGGLSGAHHALFLATQPDAL